MTQTAGKDVSLPELPVILSGFRVRSKDAWEQFTPIYDFTPISQTTTRSLFVNQTWIAGGLLFGEHAFDANMIERTSRHFPETDHVVIFHRYVRGHSHGLANGKPFSTFPGMVAVRDYARTFKGYQSPSVSQGVYVRRDQVGFNRKSDDGQLAFAEHTLIGRVLNAELDQFFDHFKQGARSVDPARLQRLIACFAVALNGRAAKQDVRALARNALSDVIRDYIEANLASARLSSERLLTEFGVSRATLYRIFERDGGVRNYISTRRLIRSAIDLASTPTRRGEITKTAERWGFSSSANFNRAVKNYFGTAPGSMFEHPISRNRRRRDGGHRGEAFASNVLWQHRRALRAEAF